MRRALRSPLPPASARALRSRGATTRPGAAPEPESTSDPGRATGQRALPRAAVPFVAFPSVLRDRGFAVAPEQTRAFVEAVGVLGPRTMGDVHAAALATLAPPPERRDEFDALYRLVFLGHSLAEPVVGADDTLEAFDERDGTMEPPEADDVNEVGERASATEALTLRAFEPLGDEAALRDFARRAPDALPRRSTWRHRRARRGRRWDMRRTLRDAVRRDGEVFEIPRLRRRTRQRRIVLLVDVSGSMRAQTDAYLRVAHALARASERLETFTLGTRLTRVSRALRIRDAEQALAIAGTLVADRDGGTRLGDALAAFLGVPRFAGFARGALVVVLSDGLERGEHAVMAAAVERLSRLAWRLHWLTPLAGGAAFRPETVALRAVAPHVDGFGRAASAADVCAELLALSREPVGRSAGRPVA